MILPFLRSRRQRLEDEAADEFRQLSRRYRAGEKQVIKVYLYCYPYLYDSGPRLFGGNLPVVAVQ